VTDFIVPEALRELAGQFPGLRLLVLHGSRARHDSNLKSDWDFACLGDDNLDHLSLRDRLSAALGTDNIDLADLSGAGGLLRYRVARGGRLIFEREQGVFDDFRIRAALFWFDVEPIVRAEHAAILEALG